MPSEKHREAEELSVAASKAMAQGRVQDALKLYARAAKLEQVALKAIPADKSRTRSILSVSVASLLYKAQMFEEAEIAIFRSLASQELLPWADLQLREQQSAFGVRRCRTRSARHRPEPHLLSHRWRHP